MAMPTTFNELASEAALWLHRTDLTAMIPNFIGMAGLNINRQMNLQPTQVEASLTTTIGSRYLTLPSDYSEPIAMWNETFNPRKEIEFFMPSLLEFVEINSLPTRYTIDGEQIALNRPADRAYDITFRYKSGFTLSSTYQTNWLMTRYPDVYLYGTLSAAAPYIRDQAQAAQWKALFDDAVRQVKFVQAAPGALSTLSVDKAAQSRRGYFNIIEG